MTWRRSACLCLLASVGLAGACGEELAEREVGGPSPAVSACELVQASDLQQIFVNDLTLDEASATEDSCTWNDVETGQPYIRYEVHPYAEDLRARVQALQEEQGEASGGQVVKGIGDTAIWTDLGLFVNRNGRTLQITPLRDSGDRAPYQELARLLLTRMEAGQGS